MESGIRPGASRAALLAASAAFLLYLPTLAADFVLDDVAAIKENRVVRAPQGIGELLVTPYWNSSCVRNAWRPLVLLGYAGEWRLWAGAPWGFHLTNVTLHAAASALVAYLAAAAVAPAAAAVAAPAAGLAFALHPIHVEAVANVSGRPDLLAACFTLAFLAFRARAPATTKRGRIAREAGAALCYACALLAKESAAIAPALALLFDAVRDRDELATRLGRRAWAARTAPAVAAWGLLFLVYFLTRGAVLGTFTAQLRSFEEFHFAPDERLRVAFGVLADQLRLLVFPDPLTAQRAVNILPGPLVGTGAAVAGAALLFLGLPMGVVASWRRGGGGACALIWLAVTMLPGSNLIVPIGVLQADRLLYLPSVGGALLFGVLVARAWSGARARGAPPAAPAPAPGPRRPHVALRGLLLGTAAAAAGMSLLRCDAWSSQEALILDCVRQEPANPWACVALSGLLLDADDPAAAEAAANRALAHLPDYSLGLEARGLARMRLGKNAAALADLAGSFAHAPTARKALAIGLLYDGAERPGEAEEWLARAAAAAPEDAEVLNGYGTWLARRRGPGAGLPWFERAAALAPASTAVRVNLGLARLALGDARGVDDVRSASAAARADATVFYRAVLGLARAGRAEATLDLLAMQGDATPERLRAHEAAGLALVRAGRIDAARRVVELMRGRGAEPSPEFAAALAGR